MRDFILKHAKKFLPKESSKVNETLLSTEREYLRLKSLNKEQQIEFGKSLIKTQLSKYRRKLRESINATDKNSKLLNEVEHWKPPSQEHQTFKTFLILKLESSVSYKDPNWYKNAIEEWRNCPPLKAYEDEVKETVEEINRLKKKVKEEESRNAYFQNWYDNLVESLDG